MARKKRNRKQPNYLGRGFDPKYRWPDKVKNLTTECGAAVNYLDEETARIWVTPDSFILITKDEVHRLYKGFKSGRYPDPNFDEHDS